MKRPPELFEFLKPTGKDSEKRVISRSLKYWRLQTPAASAAREEKPRAAKEPKKRRSPPKKVPKPPEEPAEPVAPRRPGRLSVSRFALGAFAALLLLLVGIAYVLGKAQRSGTVAPSLSLSAVEPTESAIPEFTVQAIFWKQTTAKEEAAARDVVEFLQKDDYLTKLAGLPRIVRVKDAGETRVYVGRAPAKTDPTLRKILDRISTYEVSFQGKKQRPFESAFIRAWNDSTSS
jgi:hypothetical protein